MASEKTTKTTTEFPASAELTDVSPQELDERIAQLNKQLEQEQRWQQFGRKAMDLEKLKLANRARRCSYLKSNGQNCRAPAMGQRLFCVFHVRAMDQADAPQMKVQVLADRQSIQLTLKQIMEHLVAGRITPQIASPLLRAAYIALATLKPKPSQARRVQAAPNHKGVVDDKSAAVEKTEEELDAELEQLEAEIKELQEILKIAEDCSGDTPKTGGDTPCKSRGNPEEISG